VPAETFTYSGNVDFASNRKDAIMQWANVLYYLAMAGLFFAMMRFGCGAHVMGHGHHHGNASSLPPDKSVDPVCGMTVPTATAKSSILGGIAYYFCSQDCREKFESAPTAYAKANGAPIRHEHHHGC
jgi:YHS domain-containing protein